MSFDVSPARKGRQFSYEGNDGKIRMRRTLEYDVTYTGGSEPNSISEPAVMAAAGLPKVNYSTYEHEGSFVPYLLCKRKSAKQNPKISRRWLITCEYESEPREGDEQDEEQAIAEPLSVAPKIDVSSEVYTFPALRDRDGKSILTPSGRFYETPLHGELTITVLQITQYELGWNIEKLATRNRHANSTEYLGRAAHKWKIFDITATPTEVLGYKVHQVAYTVKYHPGLNGWKEERFAIDTHYLVYDGADVKRRPFLSLGQPTTGFVHIGNPDDPSEDPKRGTPRAVKDGPQTDVFRMLDETDFTAFLPYIASDKLPAEES